MIEDQCRKYLLELARKVAKKRGVSLATVARDVHGSHDFLDRFNAGEVSVTIRKFDEMVAALKAQCESGLELFTVGGAVNTDNKPVTKKRAA